MNKLKQASVSKLTDNEGNNVAMNKNEIKKSGEEYYELIHNLEKWNRK